MGRDQSLGFLGWVGLKLGLGLVWDDTPRTPSIHGLHANLS